jgi:hypothetical protein
MSPEEQMKERIGEEISAHTAKKIAKIVAAVVGGVFMVVFLGFFLGWVIQFLWNYTLVDMFDWPSISYWQAIGMFLLAKIFFGFGHSSSSKHKGSQRDEKEEQKVRQWWGRRMGKTYEHESTLTKDEMFKKYWQEEGKAAYEAYAAGHQNDSQKRPNL